MVLYFLNLNWFCGNWQRYRVKLRVAMKVNKSPFLNFIKCIFFKLTDYDTLHYLLLWQHLSRLVNLPMSYFETTFQDLPHLCHSMSVSVCL